MAGERLAWGRALVFSVGATAAAIGVGVVVTLGPAAGPVAAAARAQATDTSPVEAGAGPSAAPAPRSAPPSIRLSEALAPKTSASANRRKAAPDAVRPPPPPALPQPVRMVQANIKVSLPATAYAADLGEVLASQPDFVTLNEADSRSPEQITPAGYASYRGMDSAFTRETPVLWRTDRWEKVSVGTRYLTTRQVRWGVRAVNWVTVRNLATGQILTVVSAHPAPTTRATGGLLPVFATRLAGLVHELDDQGAVLVGGDLNAAYRSRLYPAAALASAGLSPSHAILGAPAGGTGDYRGATIDFVLYQSGRDLAPQEQGTYELLSDHDALWVDFLLDPPS